jgi:hypothetical protein
MKLLMSPINRESFPLPSKTLIEETPLIANSVGAPPFSVT